LYRLPGRSIAIDLASHPKLEPSGNLTCFCVRLLIVDLIHLVKLSSSAVRARHRKFSRQTFCVEHGNFA
jgi:hypothetical protein